MNDQNVENNDEDLDDLGLGSIECEYQIPKELQKCLDDYYFLSANSFLFHHKPSKCLLLMFNEYVVQMAIDFNTKCMTTLNVGNIDNMNDKENEAEIELNRTETNVSENIIGYNEFRSCLILHLKECAKELSLVYTFKISMIMATGFASKLEPFNYLMMKRKKKNNYCHY